MSIDEKLGLNKFNIDEEHAHILVNDLSAEQAGYLCEICPANLYRMENGELKFDYAGCLECGTCKMVSFIHGASKTAANENEFASANNSGALLKQWRVPEASFGVLYRHG